MRIIDAARNFRQQGFSKCVALVNGDLSSSRFVEITRFAGENKATLTAPKGKGIKVLRLLVKFPNEEQQVFTFSELMSKLMRF